MKYTNITLKYPEELEEFESMNERLTALVHYGAHLLVREGFETVAEKLIEDTEDLKYHWQTFNILKHYFDLEPIKESDRPYLLRGQVVRIGSLPEIQQKLPWDFQEIAEVGPQLREWANIELEGEGPRAAEDPFSVQFRLVFSDGTNQKFLMRHILSYPFDQDTVAEFVWRCWRLQGGLAQRWRLKYSSEANTILDNQNNQDVNYEPSVYLRRLFLFNLKHLENPF